MTSGDRLLDPETFLGSPLFLYRLVRQKYADLAGIGAAQTPGRWNKPGQKAIYTSTEIGITLLERLAHTRKDIIPSNLAMMKIRVQGDWLIRTDEISDRNDNGSFLFFRTLNSATNYFQGLPPFSVFKKPFAVAVPSVIVPSWNVVLYPNGTEFWSHVSIETIEPFEFDPRLFAAGAQAEAGQWP